MSEVDAMYAEADRLKDAGDLPAAIDQLVALLKIDPRYVLAHLALAVIYGRVQRHEEAIEHAELACQIDPTDAFNFTAMSVTYQRAWQGTQEPQYIQLAEAAMARARGLEGRG